MKLYGKYAVRGSYPSHGEIHEATLINATTGEPIPDDEPVFIIRGKDKHAVRVIDFYMRCCNVKEHAKRARDLLALFKEFRDKNPDRMKEPD